VPTSFTATSAQATRVRMIAFLALTGLGSFGHAMGSMRQANWEDEYMEWITPDVMLSFAILVFLLLLFLGLQMQLSKLSHQIRDLSERIEKK
jgi:hypothetical protein